jgi:uncharacterized protein (DUF2147 family)
MSSKTLALALSDNTRNRDNSSFIYHFQNCTALTTQSSATFSVSRISAAAPLTQAAASGSANEAIAATPNTGAAKGIKIGSYVAKLIPKSKSLPSTVFAEIVEDIRVECKDLDGKKMCKPIKVDAPVDEGFKLMKDIHI